MNAPVKDDADAVADGILDASYCTTIEQFFLPPSRDLIGRYLSGFLDQLVITPTELVHSAKYQKRLHDAGRVLMNIVDKIGTIQARHKSISASARVRELHALVSQASRKVWDDEKEKPIPSVKVETFCDVIAKLPAADREYLGNRILAEFLSAHKVWKDKIIVLVRMLGLAEGKDAFPMIEVQLAECLKSDPALDQLLGMPERVETRCNDLIDLWKGTWEPRDGTDQVVADLNKLIAGGTVPNVKAAMEYSLLRTLNGKNPLRSAEPEPEIQAVFDLFRRMWVNQALIGGSKALAMLEKRQTRGISTEGVTDLLRERKVLADRLLYLMTLTALAVGGGNRTTLKTFIDHYFGDRDFVLRVISGQEPPVPKLQTFTQIHRALRASWLPEEEKTSHCAQVELAQGELMKRSRLFEQIDKKGGGPAAKVLTVVDLCRKGTFIDGANLDTVRRLLQTWLQDPMFVPEYIAGSTGEDRERKVILLAKTLASINVPWNP